MKTYVVIENSHFLTFLEHHNLSNIPENFQRFLSEIGATRISFITPMDASIEVPSGSCVRLHTPETYNKVVQEKLQKKNPIEAINKLQSLPQTNSCTIQ